MNDKRNRIISFVLISMCFLMILSGCTNVDSRSNSPIEEQPGLPSIVETTPIPEDVKHTIARQLLEEFHKHYNLIDSEASPEIAFAPDAKDQYDRIMALDRAIGITSVYADVIEPAILDEVYAAKQALIGGARPVYSGYTQSGIHILALKHPDIRSELEAIGIADQFRGTKDEADLLTASQFADGVNLYLWDVYVEDLTKKADKIEVDTRFYTTNIREKGDQYQLPNIYDLTDEQRDFLAEYGRTLDNNHKMTNKSWKLFAVNLKVPETEPFLASERLVYAVVNGEEVELRSYY